MGLLALLLWPARGLFAYTACALALYLLVVSVGLNKLAMYRRNAFLPFGGQKTADHLWRYSGSNRKAPSWNMLSPNKRVALPGPMERGRIWCPFCQVAAHPMSKQAAGGAAGAS